MGHPTLERERDRYRHPWRAAGVVGLSVGATGLFLVAGLGLLLVGTGHAVGHAAGDALDSFSKALFAETPTGTATVTVPAPACPYLRVVAAAADHATAPWLETFRPEPDWSRFSHDLSAPLADLDAALGAAIPHLPAPAAGELAAVRGAVERGRSELRTAGSVREFTNRVDAGDGSFGLRQTGVFSSGACGLAPGQ